MQVQVNGGDREFLGKHVADLLIELGHDPATPGIAVARNGEIVRRAQWNLQEVTAGDRIDIVGAVQGG